MSSRDASRSGPLPQPPVHRRHDEVLADIARFAGSSLDLEDVLDRIVQRAAELTGADRANLWLLDRSGRRLLPSALYGMDPDFTAGWKTRPLNLADEPLSRQAIESGEAVVVVDAAADPRTDKASVQFFGDQSILVAPLARRGKILGTLFLNHVRERYVFTQEDVETTTAIANQAAIAIDNARLYTDTRRLAEQLRRSFHYAGQALAAGVDLQQTLQSMVQLAVETVAAAGGSLSLLDEGGRGTHLVASAGRPREDGSAASEFPLAAAGRPLGSLALWRSGPPFDAEERQLLSSFAGHASAAIEHARLYAGLQEEQDRARQAERTQQDFVSMVSHELRTPLALIKAYVSTLLRPNLSLPPQKIQSFLEGIDGACDRLRQLIDNLLSATSLEAGRFAISPEPVEVTALLREVHAQTTALAPGRRLDVRLPASELWVLADPHLLAQVVQNLVGNALKYAPGDTPVRIEAALDGHHVRLGVLDSGPGIPEEALELVFEKFYRVSVAAHQSDLDGLGAEAETEAAGRRTEHGGRGGLGLGLYICRRIVEAHGGRIWAENLSQGGAAFRLELPLSRGAP